MIFLESDWCGLPWSPWVPMDNSAMRKSLPASAGLYRVRARDDNFLVYIGQTGRQVRQRVGELASYSRDPHLMPFNDPHTAAPAFWAWHDATGMEFECSGNVAPGEPIESKRWRHGCEAYLLWRYRCEYGSSTLCNHGRFHPNYDKSTNRREGQRGGRLEPGKNNVAGGPSVAPLQLEGMPTDDGWMGVNWSEGAPLTLTTWRDLPAAPGLYCIIDTDTDEMVYVGEAMSLQRRWKNHKMLTVTGRSFAISYAVLAEYTPKHQRLELENDLIGGYFSRYRNVPEFQILTF